MSIERLEGRLIWTLAQLTALTANVNRGKGTSAFSTEDFVPKWIGDEPELTDEEEMVVMNSKFDSYNAQVAKFYGEV